MDRSMCTATRWCVGLAGNFGCTPWALIRTALELAHLFTTNHWFR